MDKITEEETMPMADEPRLALSELLREAELEEDTDFLRDGMRVLSQALMEVRQHPGAERTAARSGQRHGYHERSWEPRVGTIARRVLRVWDGRSTRASWSRASGQSGAGGGGAGGVRPGRVLAAGDDLVQASGLQGISKSRVRRRGQSWTPGRSASVRGG